LFAASEFGGIRLVRVSDGLLLPFKMPRTYHQGALKPPLGK
jgi:hypothetical protein